MSVSSYRRYAFLLFVVQALNVLTDYGRMDDWTTAANDAKPVESGL